MLTDETLTKIRQDIDHIDIELLNLLNKRAELCNQVGEHKLESSIATRDLDREKDIINKKIALGKRLGLNEHFVYKLFDLIIEQSVKKQYQMKIGRDQTSTPLRVAYLGDQGSYSHQALLQHFADQKISPVGFNQFKEILNAVQEGELDLGLLPIENTTSGSILEVYDLLQGSGIHIIGEEILEINHCLVGQNIDAKNITRVLGHPQALTQCNNLLAKNPQWKIEYCSSSAEAIELLIKRKEHSQVAVANEFAAELYGLKTIVKNTANNNKNFTRFIIISKEQTSIPIEVPCKVSLVFATAQSSGSLVTVLNILKKYRIVMTKLQSRPIPEMPWEELFYLDINAHIDLHEVQHALQEAESHCKFLKVLGCYPNCQLEKANVELKA